MSEVPFEKTIAISQLLLDIQNPRLPEIQASQQDAVRTMLRSQREKILALAQHLSDNGPNPATLPIVMASDDRDGHYVVLDGNRRITALKLLESPTLGDGVLEAGQLRKLKRLSSRFEKTPTTELNCVVVGDRDQADAWIQLIHRGENEGAGLVGWDGQVAARYDARRGSRAESLLVLDFVRDHGSLSSETRRRIEAGKFPITSLRRLLNTPYVRKKLGIERVNGEIVTTYPKEEVLKGLTRVVEDLGSGRVTVSRIKSQEQRIDYINGILENDLPDPSKVLNTASPLGSLPENAVATKSKGQTGKRQSRASVRTTLIPSDCRLHTGQPRIRKIAAELKRLSVDDFPNATAVILRVFIELSLDHYLEHELKWTEPQIDNSKLAQKLGAVASHFESTGVMSAAALAPVKKAAAGQTLLAASVKTLNAYIHNRHFSPVASELKTAWDDLQPFMERLLAP